VTAALLVVVGLCLVAATGVVAASLLALRSAAELVVAVYVFAYAEVVGLVLFLSLFSEPSRGSLLVGSVAALAGAFGVRLLAGRGSLPSLHGADLRMLARRWPLRALGAVVAVAFGYVVALAWWTPPNGWDQLNYHLARAALWLQNGVGYVDSAYDERLNIYPPNGEIPFTFLLGVSGDENAAATAQLVASLASAVGVFALARRFGMTAAEACFGALLFLTLPVVVLQSATTKNDVMVASALIAAAVFLLVDTRRAQVATALATTLAMGGKFTAGYGVLLLLVLALVARPPSLRVWRSGAVVGGALLGSYWYAVNTSQGGGLLGERPSIPGLTAFLQPAENLVALFGLTVDWLDVSGAVGRDLLLYLAAAAAVAAGFAIAEARRSSADWRSPLVAGALVASPLVVWVVATEVGRPALVDLDDALGAERAFLADGGTAASPTTASDTASWFGPAGLLLCVGAAIAALVLVRRRQLERTALVAALAPVIWMGLVAMSLTYHPWQGRFFVFPVALSASLWGLAMRRSVLAWSVVALAATTVALTLVHYEEKPSGVRLLDRHDVASAWSMRRSQVQSLHDPSLEPVFAFLDDRVASTDSVALALGANDFGYPAFGSSLDRRVDLVPFGSPATEVGATWLYANPERAVEIDPACWSTAFQSASGTVFRRAEACS
jgi:hypothetical protein